jgi:hypothetical protein
MRTFTVSGETDLPDGARLDFTVIRGDLPCCSKETSTSLVNHGSYLVSFDLTGWPGGTHNLWVEFWPGHGQSEAIQEEYGTDGSKMSGGRIRPNADGLGWEWFADSEFVLP